MPDNEKQIVRMSDRPKGWQRSDEARFQSWYRTVAKRFGLDPNPDAPEHHYNYRFAFKSGAWGDQDGHWPSDFKTKDHPNRKVGGKDTAGTTMPMDPRRLPGAVALQRSMEQMDRRDQAREGRSDVNRFEKEALAAMDRRDKAREGARRAPDPNNVSESAGVLPEGTARDLGVWGLNAAIALPEALVGIADIPTLGAVGKGLEYFGYRPSEARRITNTQWASPEQQAAHRELEQAQGVGGTLATIGRNPRLAVQAAVESVPSMLAGGWLGRGISAAGRLGPAAGAAIGEGLMMAGTQAEQQRAQTESGYLSPEQAGLAALTGLAGGTIGYGGGRLAERFGFADPDVLFPRTAAAPARNRLMTVPKGAASEAGEEALQSIAETVSQNLSEGRDPYDGLPKNATVGAVVGGIMGAGSQPFSQPRTLATVGTAAPPTDNAFVAEHGSPDAVYAQKIDTASGRGYQQPSYSQDAPVDAMQDISGSYRRYQAEDPLAEQKAAAMRASATETKQALDNQKKGRGGAPAPDVQVGITGPQVISDEQFAQQVPPVPTEAMPGKGGAKFIGWQEVMPGEPPVAMYDWPIDDGRMTTGSGGDLRKAGFAVPEPNEPPPGAGSWTDPGDLLPDQMETLRRYQPPQTPESGNVVPFEPRTGTAPAMAGSRGVADFTAARNDLQAQADATGAVLAGGAITPSADVPIVHDEAFGGWQTHARGGKYFMTHPSLSAPLGPFNSQDEAFDAYLANEYGPEGTERVDLQSATPETLQAAADAGKSAVEFEAGGQRWSVPIVDEAKRFISDEEGSVKLSAFVPSRWMKKALTPQESGKLRHDTGQRLADLFKSLPPTKDYVHAALAGKAKRGWYRDSGRVLSEIYGEDAPRFAFLLAALSPRVDVAANLQNAARMWANWDEAGRPTDKQTIESLLYDSVRGTSARDDNGETVASGKVLPSWLNNVVRALSAEDASATMLSGPKVHSFASNLLGNMEEVTNDTWMAIFAGLDPDATAAGKDTAKPPLRMSGSINKAGTDPGKGPGYMALSAKVRQAAKELTELTGETWTPAEVQETVWSWAKTLYEAAEESGMSARDFLKSGQLTAERIAEAPDFALLFSKDPLVREVLERTGYGDALERVASGSRTGDAVAAEAARRAGREVDPSYAILDRSARRLDSIRRQREVNAAATRAGLRKTRWSKQRPDDEGAGGPAADAEGAGLRGPGGVRGSAGMVAEPGGPDRAEPPALLEGLKPTVKLGGKEIPVRPFAPAIDAARRYMESVGLGNRPRLRTYQPVDEARAKRIADAFESMEHNPSDPEVQAAYRALIDETLAQFQAIKDTGLKIEFLDGRGRDPKTGKDPYPLGPRQAIQDVHDNNHLWVFPTEGGFGTSDADVSGNPLLEMTDEVIDGKQRTANDVFRIVHDYFGHIAEGVGFRANGEENAWRLHSQMFSPEARRALTSETRGQNSWVNYGPHGEQNRNAPTEETIFADQKTGLLPQWVVDDGAHDPEEDLPDWVTEGTRAPAPEPSRKSPKARIGQNRFDNWYGYLGNRRVIEFGNSKTETAEQAAKRWLQEQEGGPRGGVMAEAKRFLSDEEGSVTIPSWLMPRRQYNNNNRVKTATELSGQSKPWRITMEDASGNDVSLLFKQHKDDDVTNIRDEISQEDAPGMLRDQLSYRVAEALGFDKLVPETEATEVGGLADAKAGGKLAKFGMVDDERATGSAMQWLDNVVEFGQLSEEDRKTAGTPLEWYQLNVLDFLIGQTDRHGRNLLVDKEPDADGVRHIHASDNTLSFPRISPEPGRPGMKGLRIVKHGAWNMAATPEERAAIVERLSQTDWSGVLEGLGEKAKQAFMDRLEFVKRHVEANTFHLPVRYSAAQWRD